MAIRYFNLKQGSREVPGGLIKIDTFAKGLEKITDFNGDLSTSLWVFRFLRKEGREEVYEVLISNEKITRWPFGEDALGGRIGVPVPVKEGEADSIILKLTNQGELSLYDSKAGEVYLSEISEDEAEKMREKETLWSLQRAYIYE